MKLSSLSTSWQGRSLEDVYKIKNSFFFLELISKNQFNLLLHRHFWALSFIIDGPRGNVYGRLNASWKICSLAVNGQSFLVIDGYL
jgi:hypothetical protein